MGTAKSAACASGGTMSSAMDRRVDNLLGNTPSSRTERSTTSYEGGVKTTTYTVESTGSPRSPNTSPRSIQFTVDKLEDQIATLKFRHDNPQDEAKFLKEQIDEGGNRHGRIMVVEKMVFDSRAQIQEMMAENERLRDLLDKVREERNSGFKVRDDRIAELLRLIGLKEQSEDSKKLAEAKRLQLNQLLDANQRLQDEVDSGRDELERLRAEKDRLRELLNAYISMRQDLRNLLTLKKQVDSLVKVEVDSFAFNTL